MWDTAVTDEEFWHLVARFDPNQLGLRVPAVFKYCLMYDENQMSAILPTKEEAEQAAEVMRQGNFPNAHVVTLGYAPDGEPLGVVSKTALGSAWDYDPDKDPDLREMIRRRLRELKPGMRVRSTYTREEGTIDSIEGEEIFIDWDDGDYSPVSVGAITPIDQGMQLKLADYDLWERGKDTPRLKSPKYDFVTMPGWGPNAHRWLLVSPHLGFSVFPLTVDAANDYIQNQGIEFIRWNELPEEVKQPIAKQLRQPETDRGFFKAPPPSQGLLF